MENTPCYRMPYSFVKNRKNLFSIEEFGLFHFLLAEAWGRKEPTEILGHTISIGELLTTVHILSMRTQAGEKKVKAFLKKTINGGLVGLRSGDLRGNNQLLWLEVLNYEAEFADE